MTRPKIDDPGGKQVLGTYAIGFAVVRPGVGWGSGNVEAVKECAPMRTLSR